MGAALVIALWPADSPTHGIEFWGYVFGIPNAVFMVLLGLDRAAHEALWFQAHYRNLFRTKWLEDKVREAQQPLHVLAVGCCLPIGEQRLAAAMAGTKVLPKSQAPRTGSGVVVHGRFEDTGLLVDDPSDIPPVEIDLEAEIDTEAQSLPPRQRRKVTPLTLKIAQALEPLAPSLQALTQYESIHWPQVRVLSTPGEATLREIQVRDALRIAGLPELPCQAIPATDGLLIADAWLDARERRPLLVIAAAWHDADPPVGSTEGCVAVLLASGFYRLPEPVKAIGTLHRPVAGERSALGDLFANTVVWGKVNGPEVTHAWITGLNGNHDNALLAGLREASLLGVARHEAQRRPDRIIGDAGNANGWLSVVAAIQSAEPGPHLIVDRDQAAVVYLHSHSRNDIPDE
ncbi:hypothetical protein [Paraburkholderia humisilvae]|uniref:hypothetical protein n=1 Tax=Paraburkholderia humisilvae TaxID=627669 RepID=UPI001FEB0A76|nr:hypothetical protein [Paraburkholderia humisilvae]